MNSPSQQSTVLDVLLLVLLREEVDVCLLEGFPLGAGDCRHGDALRYLELPRYALGVEGADVAEVGGVRLLIEVLGVGVDKGAPAVLDGQREVVSLAEVEFAVVFLARAELCLCRLRALRPRTKSFDVVVSVLVGE